GPDERAELRRSLTDHAATLEQVAGRPIDLAEARAALTEGFITALSLELVPGDLLPEEVGWAEDLMRERYATPDWTGRK
ncbi:MAG TPA: octanoyltransferase, partial [Anaerolineae bacterium]